MNNGKIRTLRVSEAQLEEGKTNHRNRELNTQIGMKSNHLFKKGVRPSFTYGGINHKIQLKTTNPLNLKSGGVPI